MTEFGIKYDKPYYVEVDPSVDILDALARVTYPWKAAVAEIVDNSLDAISSRSTQGNGKVWIVAEETHGVIDTLWVIDNGIGMSRKSLPNCLRLGSSEKDSNKSNIGVFGMGLKTAGMSIGTKIEVISRDKESENFTFISWDPPKMKEKQLFEAECGVPSQEDVSFIEDKIGASSGTAVKITGVQLKGALPQRNTNVYLYLEEHFNRIYRTALNPESPHHIDFEILLGKTERKKVSSETFIDPLFIEGKTEWYEGGPNHCDVIPYKDEQGNEFNVGIRLGWTQIGSGKGQDYPTLGKGVFGAYKQGFYCIRGARDISFVKGQELFSGKGLDRVSNLLGELHFEDTGKDIEFPISTDFAKKEVNVRPHFQKFLLSYLETTLAFVKKEHTAKKADITTTQKAAKKHTSEILGSLIKSERKGKSPDGSAKKGEDSIKTSRQPRKRYAGKSGKTHIIKDQYGMKSKFEFEEVYDARTKGLPFWEDIQTDGTFKIIINKSNLFVEKIIDESPELIYAMAASWVRLFPNCLKPEVDIYDILTEFGALMNDFCNSYDHTKERQYAEEMAFSA